MDDVAKEGWYRKSHEIKSVQKVHRDHENLKRYKNQAVTRQLRGAAPILK